MGQRICNLIDRPATWARILVQAHLLLGLALRAGDEPVPTVNVNKCSSAATGYRLLRDVSIATVSQSRGASLLTLHDLKPPAIIVVSTEDFQKIHGNCFERCRGIRHRDLAQSAQNCAQRHSACAFMCAAGAGGGMKARHNVEEIRTSKRRISEDRAGEL
jgi:hypothetical protein